MSTTLEGKWVVIAGVFTAFDRHELKKALIKRGARVCTILDRRIDFLIAGDAPGRRLQQAEYFKVRVLDETKILKLLRETADVEEPATLAEPTKQTS